MALLTVPTIGPTFDQANKFHKKKFMKKKEFRKSRIFGGSDATN